MFKMTDMISIKSKNVTKRSLKDALGVSSVYSRPTVFTDITEFRFCDGIVLNNVEYFVPYTLIAHYRDNVTDISITLNEDDENFNLIMEDMCQTLQEKIDSFTQNSYANIMLKIK